MNIFNFLFGNKKAKSTSLPVEDKIIFCHDFVEIPSMNFFGPFRKSHSGKWIICWSDNNDKNHIGGHRDSGYGIYILCYKNEVILQGKLQRPNSGSVADNGSFAIEDWHFGSDLSGTFYVFSSSGQKLVSRRFKANLYNSSISNNGLFAICQTANSSDGEDGNKLTAFDVKNRIELFSVQPPTGWAEYYKFIEDIPFFCVSIKDVGMFRYDIKGNFVDSDSFDTARLQCDRFDIILFAAEEILIRSVLDDSIANNILNASKKALILGADKDRHWKSMALKIQGLAYEFLNRNEEAITAFDEAASINPKIGVKRKANSLRKKLQYAQTQLHKIP